MQLTHETILNWLKETDIEKLKTLWQMADEARHAHVGDDVHLRGLIEISNKCCRKCAYCGLNATNKKIKRYQMTRDEILDCAQKAYEFGYGTIVMQAGEDPSLTKEDIEQIIKTIKARFPLAITLSLGERSYDELKTWKEAGADRYLLRFETNDTELYEVIHPPKSEFAPSRFDILRMLKSLGYEVGSGVMIGIPGQSYQSLARDILLFQELDLDMIGVGPYIENPDAPLVSFKFKPKTFEEYQVPATELMTYKVVALTRLVCPQANIPSTTALATLNTAMGRELGLLRGANVVMPNLTPPKYRQNYEIYPGKACLNDTAEHCNTCMKNRILAIHRKIGQGPGNRKTT